MVRYGGKKMSIDKKMGKLWYIPNSENEPIIATCKNSDSILGIWSWMKKKGSVEDKI